jgi:hypothetical protein
VTTIIELVTRCEQGAADAIAVSDRLMAAAIAAGPGSAQRRDIAIAHCLVRIAELWLQRRPTVPINAAPMPTQDELSTYLVALDDELSNLHIDRDLDPSTHLVVERIRAELAAINDLRGPAL